MKKAVILAAVLGLALSGGVSACPQDQFKEQGGNFRWLVQGTFNGQQFRQSGNGARSFRLLFFRLLREYREESGKRGKRRRGRAVTTIPVGLPTGATP